MRIGIIGAGMIGSTLARLWANADHDVRVASRHPETLNGLIQELGTRASAGTPTDTATFGDVVLLAVPLKAIPDVANVIGDVFRGKVVLDAGNAYEQRDGSVAREAIAHPWGSAGWAAAKFPGSRWVKAFNTVNFKVLAAEAHREGDRLGIPVAGDNGEAVEVAGRLARDAGFEPVVVGALGRGKEFEPGTKAYDSGMSGRDLGELFTSVRTAGG